MTVPGIDVSHWQAVTPPLGSVEFLIARATIGTQPDESYSMHITNARKAGIVTGAYHFNWDTVSIAAQVDAFLDAAGDVDLYALDVEGDHAFNSTQAKAFVSGIRSHGLKCGFYHSLNGFYDAGQDWDWVAYWSDNPPARSWDIWQFGPIKGVDGNRFNGTLEDLHWWAGGSMTAQTPISDVAPKMIDIHGGTKRYMLDSTPDGYVFGQDYPNRYSPYAAGNLRSYYANVDGKRVLRLVVPFNVQDIVGVPPDPDLTPYDQEDLDDAFNAGVDAAAAEATTAKR